MTPDELMKDKRLNEICAEVAQEYKMGGLSNGLYADYAKDVARRWADEQHVEQQTPFVTFDDGSKVLIDSWTGAAHETGWFGGITLRFVAADGVQTVRGYQALDTLATAADYEEVLADKRRLTRQLDVLLNGENAAQQASLCDLVAQVEREGIKARGPDSPFVTKLRRELLLSKMTHNFTLSRDEMIELLGGSFMEMDMKVNLSASDAAPLNPHERVQKLLDDLQKEGLKLRVWLEPQKPLAMRNHVMQYELRPADYQRVETHAEKE